MTEFIEVVTDTLGLDGPILTPTHVIAIMVLIMGLEMLASLINNLVNASHWR